MISSLNGSAFRMYLELGKGIHVIQPTVTVFVYLRERIKKKNMICNYSTAFLIRADDKQTPLQIYRRN